MLLPIVFRGIYYVYTTHILLRFGCRPMVREKKKKKLKDSQLLVRINSAERDEFVELCEELDTTAAREIRQFIRRFVKKERAQ